MKVIHYDNSLETEGVEKSKNLFKKIAIIAGIVTAVCVATVIILKATGVLFCKKDEPCDDCDCDCGCEE